MAFGFIELVLVAVIIGVLYLIYQLSQSPSSEKTPENTTTVKTVLEEKQEQPKEKPKFKIFYGSQSGTAEDYAEELGEEATQYGFETEIIEMEDYDAETDLEEEPFCVFLLATYGEGDPTDDAVNFYEWITTNEDFEDDTFGGVTFAVFALGNRQYEHFCNVGQNVHKILEKHGGSALVDCGMGDDDGSIDEDFAEWKSSFWVKTKSHFGMEGAEEVLEQIKVPFEVEFVRHPKDHAFEKTADSKTAYDAAISNYTSGCAGFNADAKFQATVFEVPENRELRQDPFEGSTRHIEINLPESCDYTTADNLGLFAHNDFKITGKLVTRLGLHAKTIMMIKNDKSGKNVFPKSCTVLDALLWYCDHTSRPRPGHLKTMSTYCTDKLERAKLLSWAGGDLKAEYNQDNKNWLEVLEECPKLNLPFDVFLHIVPKLSNWPRYYTIASSSKVHPRCVHITVTVSPAQKPRGRVYNGICSTYLKNLTPGSQVCGFIKPSSFRLPTEPRPVIMVGPGTGVAPFRAFWQEAKLLKKQGKMVEDWHLFFGCRYSDKDWIYKDEMQELPSLGIQTHFAFSRDGKEKVYVQNLMADQKLGAELWSLIHDKKARIFICGGTSMGRSVKEAFTKMAQDHGKLSAEAAKKYMEQMATSGEYIQELWS